MIYSWVYHSIIRPLLNNPGIPGSSWMPHFFHGGSAFFLDDLPAAKWMGLYKLRLCHLQMILSEHSKSESLQIMILHRIFRYFEATHDFQMFLKFLDATHEFLAFSHHVPEFFHHFCGSVHHFAALLWNPRRRQKPCSGMMRIKAVALPFCFFLFGASTVISHRI